MRPDSRSTPPSDSAIPIATASRAGPRARSASVRVVSRLLRASSTPSMTSPARSNSPDAVPSGEQTTLAQVCMPMHPYLMHTELMTRVFTYLRISLDRTGEGAAVDRQREACRNFINYKGWEHVGEYVDNSISATDRKPRPDYQRMMKDLIEGKADAVVVWKLDRLTRRLKEISDWIDLYNERGINLATTDGAIDLSSSAGQMMAGVLATFAQGEMTTKSERQQAAHVQRAQAGKPWATRRPFGFEPDAITHRADEAVMVKDAYSRLIAGESQSAIARHFNASGFTTSLGGEWRQTTARALLMNPRNAGLRAHRGEIVGKAAWAPIVDEATWRVALALMTSGKQPGGGARKHLLPGIARCGVCGGPARTAYTSRGVRMYTCAAAQHVGRNAERLEELVQTVTLERLKRADAAVLAPSEADPTEGLAEQAQILRDRLNGIAIEVATGTMLPSQVRAANAHILGQLETIENKLAAHDSTRALAPLLAAENVEAVWKETDLEQRRRIIDVLLTVHIMPTTRGSRFRPEDISIEWRNSSEA